MTGLQVALLAAVVLLAGVVLALRWRVRASAPKAVRPRQERLDTILGWPPEPTKLLNPVERRAFALLTRALPEHMVLAQVPISRFVSVPKRNSYADWLRRVGYQCVDLIVCDRSAEVVAVIELQAAEPTDRARKRLGRISRTLKAAGLPLHVWPESQLPTAERIRSTLLPDAAASPSSVIASGPLDDEDAWAPSAEGDLPEPRRTTWFDELDSEKGALDNR